MSITRIIFAILMAASIYGGANFYIARRIYQGLTFVFPQINVIIYTCVYVFIALSMILGFMPLPMNIKNIFSWISAHWMGIFMYLLIFFILADMVVLIGRLFNFVPRPIPQNIIFLRSLIAIILTVGVVGYGLYNARQIASVPYEVQLREADLDDMNVVVISDLHLGAVNSEAKIEKMVQMINDLEPDIVCMVGDIFNDDFNLIRDPDRAIASFRNIDATYGVFATLGNHDGGATLDQMINFLEESNIKLLNDEYVIIDERLALLGRLDASPIGGFGDLERQDISDAITAMDADMPVIVMEHNPTHIEEYGSEVDLILSGHTHRGQIFPGSLFTNSIYLVDYGHYQKDENSPQVIVTSGVGTWGPPMRVATNSEIVSIILK